MVTRKSRVALVWIAVSAWQRADSMVTFPCSVNVTKGMYYRGGSQQPGCQDACSVAMPASSVISHFVVCSESMNKVVVVVEWRLCMGSTVKTFPVEDYLGIVSAECLIYQQLMSTPSPQCDITSWRTTANRWQLITLGHFHLGRGRTFSSLKETGILYVELLPLSWCFLPAASLQTHMGCLMYSHGITCSVSSDQRPYFRESKVCLLLRGVSHIPVSTFF